MKFIVKILVFLLPFFTFSQSITVDPNYSANELVELVLNNSCLEVTNTAMSASQSVAYFNQNGTTFPITEGIIIRNGNTIFTQGQYTGANLSSTISTSSDTYLQNLSNTSSGQTTPIVDVAFLEFDFIPTSNSFSFDFLFASNEYGQFQCISNDIFAFALTDLNTNTTTNLAVIPGTNNPVSVKNIRNAAYNPNCNSTNPGLFSIYNPNNPAASTLNMRGHTVVMTAASQVTPNTPYRIRLSIADYGDSDYDSAVFIAAGSFVTDFDLGPNQSICNGDSFLLDTGLDNTYTIEWQLNGSTIPNETSPTYTVTQSGIYHVIIDKGSCHIEDTITFDPLVTNSPDNLYACDNGTPFSSFNLTLNNENQLGINNSNYNVQYFENLSDIPNNPITGDLTDYLSPGGTIYIKLYNTITNNFCDAVYQFSLIITAPITPGTNITGEICENDSTPYDLTQHEAAAINGQTGNYTISYHNTQSDAQNDSNPINPNVIITGTGTTTYWIRIENELNPNCFSTTNVVITINPAPIVDTLDLIVECNNTTLPAINNGTYYSGPNATGTQYNNGDFIDEGGVYYIHTGPDTNGCTNESSFEIYLVDEYYPANNHCGEFIVPTPTHNIGAFYTEAGGPNGNGTLIPAGTTYTNNTQATIIETIYFYAEVDGIVCRDEPIDIYIHGIPLIDTLNDVTYCNSYTLPSLTNGSYYSQSGGNGTVLNPGDIISVNGPNYPGTYYIYNQLAHTSSNGSPGFCPNETEFRVNLVNTSLFVPLESCGSYMLPPIAYGGYFDQPMGQGNSIDPTIPITTSQIVYYYTNTTETPNCTNNLNYNITITPLPLVDEIESNNYCGEYILPALTNGNYYMLPGGPTAPNQTPLYANQVIDLSGTSLNPGTYYVYNGPDSNGCSNEWAFTITITALPPTDPVIDRIECNPYSLPTPTNGTYYTELGGPNGSGTIVGSTEVFNADNTFYIYNFDPITNCEADIRFTVFYNGINLPDYPDITICDSENYALPPLTHTPPSPTNSYTINYYIDTDNDNIGDTIIPSGTIFNTPGTTTVYVYAQNQGRFGIICNEEDTFIITVSETPIVPDYTVYNNTSYCGSFTLPTLPTVNYDLNYYSQPGGNTADIINPSDYIYSVNAGSTPQTFQVWLYGSATNNSNCNNEEHFQFTIYPKREFSIEGGIICVNPITQIAEQPILLSSGLNPFNHTVEWYLNGTLVGTGSNYLAYNAGTYTVIPIKTTPENAPDCEYVPTTVSVEQSSTAVASVSISSPFENYAIVTVNIDIGFGIYNYQLDNQPFQTDNVFYDVGSGDHTITVRDVFGNCGDILLNATIIKYPKYFTPNADNTNDTWNIWDLRDEHPDAIISIFDRYGKLITQVQPKGNGWDGTYNGEKLPSTDYWFVVDYNYYGEERQFKAHFSLKR